MKKKIEASKSSNIDLARKIKNKYITNIKKNTKYLLLNKEKYIKSIMKKLKMPLVDSRLEAEKIVSATINIRDNYSTKAKKKFTKFER